VRIELGRDNSQFSALLVLWTLWRSQHNVSQSPALGCTNVFLVTGPGGEIIPQTGILCLCPPTVHPPFSFAGTSTSNFKFQGGGSEKNSLSRSHFQNQVQEGISSNNMMFMAKDWKCGYHMIPWPLERGAKILRHSGWATKDFVIRALLDNRQRRAMYG
jgi:hypothetical protein